MSSDAEHPEIQANGTPEIAQLENMLSELNGKKEQKRKTMVVLKAVNDEYMERQSAVYHDMINFYRSAYEKFNGVANKNNVDFEGLVHKSYTEVGARVFMASGNPRGMVSSKQESVRILKEILYWSRRTRKGIAKAPGKAMKGFGRNQVRAIENSAAVAAVNFGDFTGSVMESMRSKMADVIPDEEKEYVESLFRSAKEKYETYNDIANKVSKFPKHYGTVEAEYKMLEAECAEVSKQIKGVNALHERQAKDEMTSKLKLNYQNMLPAAARDTIVVLNHLTARNRNQLERAEKEKRDVEKQTVEIDDELRSEKYRPLDQISSIYDHLNGDKNARAHLKIMQMMREITQENIRYFRDCMVNYAKGNEFILASGLKHAGLKLDGPGVSEFMTALETFEKDKSTIDKYNELHKKTGKLIERWNKVDERIGLLSDFFNRYKT